MYSHVTCLVLFFFIKLLNAQSDEFSLHKNGSFVYPPELDGADIFDPTTNLLRPQSTVANYTTGDTIRLSWTTILESVTLTLIAWPSDNRADRQFQSYAIGPADGFPISQQTYDFKLIVDGSANAENGVRLNMYPYVYMYFDVRGKGYPSVFGSSAFIFLTITNTSSSSSSSSLSSSSTLATSASSQSTNLFAATGAVPGPVSTLRSLVPASAQTDPAAACFLQTSYSTCYATPTWWSPIPSNAQSYYSSANSGNSAACTSCPASAGGSSGKGTTLSTGAKAGIGIGASIGGLGAIAALALLAAKAGLLGGAGAGAAALGAKGAAGTSAAPASKSAALSKFIPKFLAKGALAPTSQAPIAAMSGVPGAAAAAPVLPAAGAAALASQAAHGGHAGHAGHASHGGHSGHLGHSGHAAQSGQAGNVGHAAGPAQSVPAAQATHSIPASQSLPSAQAAQAAPALNTAANAPATQAAQSAMSGLANAQPASLGAQQAAMSGIATALASSGWSGVSGGAAAAQSAWGGVGAGSGAQIPLAAATGGGMTAGQIAGTSIGGGALARGAAAGGMVAGASRLRSDSEDEQQRQSRDSYSPTDQRRISRRPVPSSAASDSLARMSFPSPIEGSSQRYSYQQQQQYGYQPPSNSSATMTNPASELPDMHYLATEMPGEDQTAEVDGQPRSEIGGRQIYESDSRQSQ